MKKRHIIMSSIVLLLTSGCSFAKQESDGTSDEIDNVTSSDTGLASYSDADLTDEHNYQHYPDNYIEETPNAKFNIKDISPKQAYFVKGTQKVTENIDFCAIVKDMLPEQDGYTYSEDEYGFYIQGEENDRGMRAYAGAGTYGCHYSSIVDSYYNGCLRIYKNDPGYNLPRYSEEKEFEFGSAEDARKDICEYFAKYGIDFSSNFTYEVYYLDHKTLAENEIHLDAYGNRKEKLYKDSWTDEDDAYLFYFQQTYCGLPFYEPDMSSRIGPENAQVKITYNKDGIAGFEMYGLRDFNMSDTECELLLFEEVMEEVKVYFNGIVDEHSYEMVEARLISDSEDFDAKERDVIPVWAITYYDYHPDYPDTPGLLTIRVNAETGQIVLHSMGDLL